MPKFTISSQATKANKKTAYQMVVQLKQGETLKPDQLDSLLLYFASSIPKKATNPMQWVAKAAAINDTRKFLNYVRVQDGTAYATDGARIHVAKVDLPEGWYCPKTLAPLTGVDAKAPDYLRVITRTKNEGTAATLGELTRGVFKDEVHLTHEQLECSAFEHQLIDALNSQDANAALEYEHFNGSYRLRGSHEFGEWVVMPLRV